VPHQRPRSSAILLHAAAPLLVTGGPGRAAPMPPFQRHPAARSGAAPRHGRPWMCHTNAPVPVSSCRTQRRCSSSRAALDVPHQCPCSSVILRHAAAPLLVTGVPLQCPRSSAILLHAAAPLLVTGGPGCAAPMPLFQCHPAARSGAAPRHRRPWACRGSGGYTIDRV
jgi:hypothetical protein